MESNETDEWNEVHRNELVSVSMRSAYRFSFKSHKCTFMNAVDNLVFCCHLLSSSFFLFFSFSHSHSTFLQQHYYSSHFQHHSNYIQYTEHKITIRLIVSAIRTICFLFSAYVLLRAFSSHDFRYKRNLLFLLSYFSLSSSFIEACIKLISSNKLFKIFIRF